MVLKTIWNVQIFAFILGRFLAQSVFCCESSKRKIILSNETCQNIITRVRDEVMNNPHRKGGSLSTIFTDIEVKVLNAPNAPACRYL